MSEVDPEAKRTAKSTAGEGATSAGYGPDSELDASVKAEVVVSLPSKRKAAGGQLKGIC